MRSSYISRLAMMTPALCGILMVTSASTVGALSPPTLRAGQVAGVCVTDADCDDGNDCTLDICNATGVCTISNVAPGAPCGDPSGTECDDPDTCDDQGVCLTNPAADETPCPDGLFCNGAETCLEGECVDGPAPCIDPQRCDEALGICVECLLDTQCDDDDACTVDECIDNACANTPDPACEVTVKLDIKPGSCPNPVNPRSKGVLPVAVIGSDAFDVSLIDVDSLVLVRADGIGGEVTPLSRRRGPRIRMSDVATPFGGALCDCHTLTRDGITDLSIKFSKTEVIRVFELRSEARNTFVTLSVQGTLLDGTPFEASDCIRILGRR